MEKREQKLVCENADYVAEKKLQCVCLQLLASVKLMIINFPYLQWLT